MERQHRKDNSVFAVYDISSSSVGGGHVLVRQGDSNNIIFLASFRNEASLQENIDIQRFVDTTATHLEKVVTQVQKADIHHPSFIQVVLGSPWYSSQTRTVTYKNEIAFVCTQKLIDSLVDAEIKDIISTQNNQFGVFGKESVIIEKQLSRIKLNGYITETPFGKKAIVLEIVLTVTIAPKSVLDRFSDILTRSYGARTIGFTTSPFATFVVLRDSRALDDACVVDIGEEVTDVIFIKEGIVLYQHSFPVGTYGLYRTLTKQNIQEPHESIALLESYRLGKLSHGAGIRVEKAINAYTLMWQHDFKEMLDTGQYGFCLPENIIVVSDKRFETLFTSLIVDDPFVKHSCAKGKAKVTFMNESLFQPIVTNTDQTPLDIPLATAALFVERMV